METAVFKVEKENINRLRYLNVMNSWATKSNYKLNKDSSIYAVSFDGTVQAGASIEMTEDDFIKILFLNNSINHQNKITEEATAQLYNLLDEEYGVKYKAIKYVKVK